jgi:hypothetical protein
MSHHRLSISMCTYNGALFLREQLKSIASQTRMPDELVVCDDGSTDATLEILADYGKDANFAVRIHCNTKRLGPAKNFERAIFLCKGDIIVLSDQDDIWRNDKLQILERVLSQNPDRGYAFSDAIMLNETNRFLRPSLWEQVSFTTQKQRIFSQSSIEQVMILSRRNVVTGATMALRAQLRETILPIPELWLHDEWMALACSIKGASGIPIQEPLIYYRKHEGQTVSISSSILKTIWQSLLNGHGGQKSYELSLRKWNSAYPFLRGLANQDPAMLHLLEEKMAHLAFRAKLGYQSRLLRLKVITPELFRGQYHIYSNGWKSAIRDFLTPAVRSMVEV